MKTNLNAKPISEVHRHFLSDLIDLSPDYQRRPVWSLRSKVYLIDTILQGLPLPKFFIQISIDEDSGEPSFAVIDGQQRLTAIFEFIDGKTDDGKPFVLSRKNHPKPETFPNQLDGLNFKALPQKYKQAFWSYKLSFEELEDATAADIRDMFVRLNISGERLNEQEIRNSVFNGAFKELAYELADEYDDLFVDLKLLSARQVKRMGDAELVSELLAAMIKGLQDKKKTLNAIYKEFDDSDSDWMDQWRTLFKKTMKLTIEVLGEDPRSTRFVNKNDFYSLFIALYVLTNEKNLKINSTVAKEIYHELATITINVKKDAEVQEFLEWYMNVNSAGDTIVSRKQRQSVLMSLLEPHCISRDSKRAFTEFDKRVIWHSSTDKQCKLCGTLVSSYADYEPDHVIPWDNGGLTVVSNGQVSHMACNRSKGSNIVLAKL
jgi:hypothetical protein